MTNDKLVPRRVGTWCLPYLYNRIGEASPPFQEIGSGIDLSEGYMFVYAPQSIDAERFRQLELGGVIAGKWLNPRTMELSPVPLQMVSRYLWKWLRNTDTAARKTPSSPLILAEETLWQPGDPDISTYLHSFTYGKTRYLWACSHDDAAWIRTLVDTVDLSGPPALLYGFVTSSRLSSDTDVLSVLKCSHEASAYLRLIVTGAFDGESFLIWRRHQRLVASTEMLLKNPTS